MLARPCPKPEPQMWDLGPELRDQWEIPRTEIQLIRKLGQGNFGEVYYGKWRNNIEVSLNNSLALSQGYLGGRVIAVVNQAYE